MAEFDLRFQIPGTVTRQAAEHTFYWPADGKGTSTLRSVRGWASSDRCDTRTSNSSAWPRWSTPQIAPCPGKLGG